MTKNNIEEQLLTLKYADRKGEGTISLAKPLKFSHGYIDVEYEYDSELSDSYCLITCSFDEGCEDGYEDDIVFYSGDTKLFQIRVKNQPDIEGMYRIEKSMAEYFGACTIHMLAPIAKAQNLNIRIISCLRKYEDIKLSGLIVEEFQKALQSLIYLIKNKKTLAAYISQRDDSFNNTLFIAAESKRVEDKNRRKKEEQEGKRRIAIEKQAEETARQKKTRKKTIGLMLVGAAGYGLVKGFRLLTTDSGTGLIIMGICFVVALVGSGLLMSEL